MEIMQRLTAFFISLLITLGAFGKSADEKNRFPVKEIALDKTDITDGYTVRVPAASGTVRFNRVRFSYETTAAVRAVFRYRQGVKTVEEELLLCSRETEASMLLNGFLKRKTASRLLSVKFEPIRAGETCVLSVSSFTCDLQAVPKDKVLYIENGRFKAGVSLNWGGGLCYFEDKLSGAYGNLLNSHDTGRLVQQSYYGPTEIEGYENGVYGDTLWPYNPVQGGDQHGNASKPVAFEKTDDQIRVVCRPLDWAQDNMPTQAYYTNVYTLTENGLRVENTAVDFLETPWSARGQELPAFYTISALGNFWFYDGDAPWTDAPLRVERDLDFWGGKPSFELQECNDEKWCAWTDDADYGVGLYTPIATSLLAGRFLYDGTADPNGNPTNYVAPVGTFVLHFDEPFTYTCHITAGTVGEIRDTFRALR